MRKERPINYDPKEYVEIGEIASSQPAPLQSQYFARYLGGVCGDPNLGEVEPAIRWFGDTSDYHDIQIHREDAQELKRRVIQYRVNHQEINPPEGYQREE